MSGYRKVSDITADEFLGQLRSYPRKQIEIFVALGGDPLDHGYARLSYLTKELRGRGVPIGSSRTKGVWLEEESA
jgi:hypothetical protein